MHLDTSPTRLDLMHAALAHLGQLAQTGCPRAGHRARLLIDHMACDNDHAGDEAQAILRHLLERLEPRNHR